MGRFHEGVAVVRERLLLAHLEALATLLLWP